jgi:hypothetical protein
MILKNIKFKILQQKINIFVLSLIINNLKIKLKNLNFLNKLINIKKKLNHNIKIIK